MAKLNQAMSDLMRYNAAIEPTKRSIFNKSHSHATTFDSAYLVPVMWDRVLPGDEKKIRFSGLARMATPIAPVMDEARLDCWAFYVPDRLWWDHAKEFYGENKYESFNPDGKYVMPYLTPAQYCVYDGFDIDQNGNGSLSDYFGFPVIPDPYNINMPLYNDNPDLWCTAGLHRSYQIIWNDYFRNSSVQEAVHINTGDTVTSLEWPHIQKIRKVCKNPDYFTMCLREPQAGDDVLLPLGEWAPVVTRNENVDGFDFPSAKPDDISYPPSLRFYNSVNDGHFRNDSTVDRIALFSKPDGDNTQPAQLMGTNSSFLGDYTTDGLAYFPTNLWTNLTSATAATINNLRAAITAQHFMEVSAIGGKRYNSLIHAHFGVLVPDGTVQRPLLLGATSTPIGMRQVLQTSATVDGQTPQGNTAAVSVTNVANEWICNQAFTEPGFIMVLCAVRPVHSYSQGIDCLLQKLQTYDHYFPVFDNLGNQPVYTREIFAGFGTVDSDQSNTVFGYKPAWQEYKFKPNRVSGLFRPDIHAPLSAWTYTSKFINPPELDTNFVQENEEIIDQTIAVKSEPQFLLDCYFDYTDIKNMSVHSLPGVTRL